MEGTLDIPSRIGDWEHDRTISAGRFGSLVLSWQNVKSREKIVTKIWCGDQHIDEPHKAKWISEISFYRNHTCGNIIAAKHLPKVFEAGLAPLNKQLLPVLCMEFCSTDLRQVLLAPENSIGLQEQHIRQILQDVKNAVEYLYQNKISHYNLRPENIVRNIVQNNESMEDDTYIYKIIDLGIAKEKGLNKCFSDNREYYAPEFIINSAKFSDVADFWSFGLVAFEIICGVRPFFPGLDVKKGMLLTQMKSHDNICAYETFHGDIEFSSEIFPENFISKPFKSLIEKWLKTALEWQPQLRGRMAPIVTLTPQVTEPYSTKNLIIFTLLDEIMSTSEVKIFSVFTLENLSFEFNSLTSVAVLKSKLKESTQIHETDQLLVSIKTKREAENEDLVISHWENNSYKTFFLFNRKQFLKEDIEFIIPTSVKRVLSDSKMLTYNHNNGYELHRCGFFFVNSLWQLHISHIKGIKAHVEYLHEQCKQLLFQHDTLSKVIGKLEAQYECVSNFIESGKEHITALSTNEMGYKFLANFNEIFSDFDNISYNWKKFETAWDQVTVRLHSCSKRSVEFSLQECDLLIQKYNFFNIIMTAKQAYMYYTKNFKELEKKDKICVVGIRSACQDALKMMSKLLAKLRHRPFVIKMIYMSVEIAKIKAILQSASDNSNKLQNDLTKVSRDFSNCLWATITFLSSNPNNVSNSLDNDPERLLSRASSERENTSATDAESLVVTSSMLRNTNAKLSTTLMANKILLKDLSWDFSFAKEPM